MNTLVIIALVWSGIMLYVGGALMVCMEVFGELLDDEFSPQVELLGSVLWPVTLVIVLICYTLYAIAMPFIAIFLFVKMSRE